MNGVEEPFLAQQSHRSPGGRPRDAELISDGGLAGDGMARGELSLGDPLPDDLGDLEVEVGVSIVVEHIEKVDEQTRALP
ncbi:hypothetical protein GCM10010140_06640 [Streptosporangium pseudovulgare]|uniref:Uncharacterized protein n=1 Tax=Streptosporangium pseudovulgare TaxID=35765 RepID=A0ABQ2QI50_9ACTN|nr:hypothetical protein GCM10010140_06640 [Streptosporangium pseudovulgare]